MALQIYNLSPFTAKVKMSAIAESLSHVFQHNDYFAC